MCGINGILRLEPTGPPVDREELLRTRDAMASRGPDGTGEWVSPDGEIGLGHRRLAIIDLSPAGLQPRARDGGRYQIVFNGEIYNYRELRRELEAQGVEFRSQTDTEVALALYALTGVKMFSRLRGMYAMAIWDAQEHTLVLARDPYGIKPLYYTTNDGILRFASQVKALEAGGQVAREPDAAGLVGYLLWGSVPEPRTIWRDVRAVPSGHFVVVERGRVGQPVAHHRFGSLDERDGDVGAALDDSVRAHLVADVPVGVFLSAGLDSSLIAALACRHSDRPLTTLTLRFDEFQGTPWDEAPVAAEVAAKLGTRHVERSVKRDEFGDLWHSAIAAMDQPSIDGFNTFVVSRIAHEEGIKVVLSGLGGDELMGSYESFVDVPRWSSWAGRMRYLPGVRSWWPTMSSWVRPDKPKLTGLPQYGPSLAGAYFLRRGLFLPRELPGLVGESLAREGLGAYDPLADAAKYLDGDDRGVSPWEAVHLMESTQYMRNQLLRDCDWASMAHSLELRVPLADARLREVIAGCAYEPARSRGKAELVKRIAPELPDSLWSRPKSGFFIPVKGWLDGDVGVETASGPGSRQLALKVLEAFGIHPG